MNVYTALQWIRDRRFKELPYNVLGAFIGPKVSNNVETGEMSLILFVNNKLPLSAIPEEYIIPKYLEIESSLCLTDVQEPKVCSTLLSDCNDLNTAVEPVKSNNVKQRPLIGGCSSINIGSTDATLGLIVRDKTDGQIVALSNAHVYAA